jgi:creatinine amidohydrolase
MSKGFFLEEMTWPQAKEAFLKTTFVVIPLGSNEQHGMHLPTGTDWKIAKELAKRLGERANVIVTPTLPIGYAKYHTVFPGTLSVSQETLTRMLIEICEDLIKYGVTHILFVNGHGGNMTSLFQAGTWLRAQSIPAAVACWWEMTEVVNPDWLATGHADYVETALMMSVDPAHLDMKSAQLPANKTLTDTISLDNLDAAKFREGKLTVNLVMSDITDNGSMVEYGLTAAKSYDVHPSSATAEMGEAMLTGLADYLADFVEEFRKVKLPALYSVGAVADLKKARQ